MAATTGESSPLQLLVLPVLLSLIDNERTCKDIARQSGLSIAKVNSVLEELQQRHLVVETTPLMNDEFVEPRFRIADGEVAMATLTNELSENPVPYVLAILDAVRNELPNAMLQGTEVQAWYSRFIFTPENANLLMDRLMQTLSEFETLQVSPANEHSHRGNHYRLSITFYQVDSQNRISNASQQ